MKPSSVLLRCRGFSMIELVVAIVLLGILAAVVVPRVGGGSGFDERGLRDQTQAALRYAQKSAIAARRTACAIFSTAATPHRVSLRIASAFGAADCSTGSALLLPDGASEVVASGGATFSAAPASIVFDANGRAALATVSVTNLSATLDIRVEAETGYVH